MSPTFLDIHHFLTTFAPSLFLTNLHAILAQTPTPLELHLLNIYAGILDRTAWIEEDACGRPLTLGRWSPSDGGGWLRVRIQRGQVYKKREMGFVALLDRRMRVLDRYGGWKAMSRPLVGTSWEHDEMRGGESDDEPESEDDDSGTDDSDSGSEDSDSKSEDYDFEPFCSDTRRLEELHKAKYWYCILDVIPDASRTEITKSYRKLALQHHPDKNPYDKAGAEIRFRAINAAYEALKTRA
ncbi:DnaJ-domain-containing protein [Saccharata proteae CBS 121410]|uniref:DnaJ-domain-containing protein n=1 Tax=Saccharata proteae CBS 121410 TaxID=1314787 RepID=A0A9P4LWR7_9PEZI|nr:DnaJ-domain-containing protein [Saccharata proteae CBS 121410]